MRSEVGHAQTQPHRELGATHHSQFSVAEVSVQVAGQSSDDVSLSASLQLFRTQTHAFDIEVCVEWTKQLPATAGQQLFDSGSAWRLYEYGSELQFDFNASVLGNQPYKRLLVDSRFRRATLQMSQSCFAGTEYAVGALEYPLDELLIMHRLTQEKA